MDRIHTFSFCDSFLERLQDYLKKEYLDQGKDFSRCAIVFGGKRPALFIKRRLAQVLQRSFQPPAFFTIDAFVTRIIEKEENFTVPEDLNSCYQIYQLTKKYCPHILKGREGFAAFLPWTREILSFMDQLDLEQIENSALKNIEANAAIGYDVPDDINQLLESIVTLREVYHKACIEQKHYSRGYQYLRAAELIHDQTFSEFDEIIFCNFFYFNRSEEKMIKHVYQQGKATLFFQGDQRKWPVLERIARRFDHNLMEGDAPDPVRFSINLYEGFDAHSQVGQVREILKKISDLEDTVIVLPDPEKIVPLLSEIAPLAEELNVSMGYPLRRSSLYSLCSFIFDAQLSRKKDRYYTKDYLKVLQHPFIKNLDFTGDRRAVRVLIHKLEEALTGKMTAMISGRSFVALSEIEASLDIIKVAQEMAERMDLDITQKDLRKILKDIHHVCFHQWEAVDRFDEFAQCIGCFLDLLVEKSFLQAYPLNINIAQKMYELKDELSQADFQNERFLLEDLVRIFDHKMALEKISFQGTPLKGLQVLGLQETRSLNFKHVIVLDVNEGTLPHLNIFEPLIPREVKISLNLNRLELEEEIQRYQFMRLISSAEDVHLVYQHSKDKEKSRFIQELIWEHEKTAPSGESLPVQKAGFQVKVSPQERTVVKTPEIIDFLKKRTYSASSINTYLRNPMDFYEQYVLGLKDAEDLLDEPEARHVGIFLHELLEEMFRPYIGKKPVFNDAFHQKADQLFHDRFDRTFGKSMKSDAFLLKRVLQERFHQFCKHEEEQLTPEVEKIMYLEHRFSHVLDLPVGAIPFNFVMDRIDQMKNGTVFMLDYKTGSMDTLPRDAVFVEAMPLSRESIFEHVRSFQVPLYTHYLNTLFPDKSVSAALYNLRTLKKTSFLHQADLAERKAMVEPYLKALNFILEEIFNPEINFTSAA